MLRRLQAPGDLGADLGGGLLGGHVAPQLGGSLVDGFAGGFRAAHKLLAQPRRPCRSTSG